MEIESGDSVANRVTVTRVPTDSLTAEATSAIRALLWTAFGDGGHAMTEDDWQNALGGVHFVAQAGGENGGYSAVAEPRLEVRGLSIRSGYVEAVAPAVAFQGKGIGSL